MLFGSIRPERASLGFLRPEACLGRESGTFGGARALIPSIPVSRAAGFPTHNPILPVWCLIFAAFAEAVADHRRDTDRR